MLLLQVLIIVPIACEYGIYFDNNGEYVPLGMPYIICESAIYLIVMLQNVVFYNFLFKFSQVEIELLII